MPTATLPAPPKRVDPARLLRLPAAAERAGVTRAKLARLVREERVPVVVVDGVNHMLDTQAEALKKAEAKAAAPAAKKPGRRKTAA